MSNYQPDPYWNIRFVASVRTLFSTIPRGEAARFAEAIEHLRAGPQQPDIEEIDDNLFAYSFNGYRIAFEIVFDAPNTLRIILFEPEEPTK